MIAEVFLIKWIERVYNVYRYFVIKKFINFNIFTCLATDVEENLRAYIIYNIIYIIYIILS